MKINDLPICERPREKLTRYGAESLSNIELLAIVIGSGNKQRNAMDIAYDLLKDRGLYGLIKTPFKDFSKINGISNVTSIKLASILELSKRISEMKIEQVNAEINADYIYKKYNQKLLAFDQEVFGIIICDKNKNILSEKILYKGTGHRIYTDNKDIFREIFISGGSKFYIFHNHPSDDPLPSDFDIAFTFNLLKESKKYELDMLDHVIISHNGYFSFKEEKEDEKLFQNNYWLRIISYDILLALSPH